MSNGKSGNKMNLAVFAMEGVSQTLFWEYREFMPGLWELHSRSASFRRFYANSTSALASFHDFAYGDSSLLDACAMYPEAPLPFSGRENLFGLLARSGYETHGAMRASPVPGYARAGFFGAWPAECGEFHCHDDSDDCCAETERFLELAADAGKPFALYFSERSARLDDAHPEKLAEETFHGRIEKGYAILDRSIDRVLRKLTELKLLADTVVVVYGPYGSDPWKHGIARGRTHALEPYADLNWTPLFIFRNGADAGITDMMLCVIDIKPTLQQMFFPDKPVPAPGNSLTGMSAFSGLSRQAAFCQNLFALERENSGAALGLIKSYAMVAGDRCLIVSSAGGIAGEGGLQLYLDFHDVGNGRNFLEFFELDSGGAIAAFGKKNIVHPHFIMSFKPNLLRELTVGYKQMREQLAAYVMEKERAALEKSDGRHQENLFPVDAFRHMRRRR